MSSPPPTERFSDRARDYARHRPGYPHALLAWLREAHGVVPSWIVADVGAGTGISTRLFLAAGHPVLAVEPNASMRAEAEAALAGDPRFRSVAAPAEATGLPDASVDLVAAAQAFHWFDAAAVHREWTRILRPGGLAAIFWNVRRTEGSPFVEGYERLLRAHTGHATVVGGHGDGEAMRRWFGRGFREERSFENPQLLDLAALRGALLSASYAPRPGQPGCEAMLEELARLFEATAVDGRVRMALETRAYVGALGT
jgi:SAM-dependent methyltransferase